jgi:hypothetical protein
MLVVVKWRVLGTLPVAESTESQGGSVVLSTANDTAGEPEALRATSADAGVSEPLTYVSETAAGAAINGVGPSTRKVTGTSPSGAG